MNPDSLVSRLRIAAARALDVGPAPGEAWCMRCEVNGGKTLVLSVTGAEAHIRAHGPGGFVAVRMAHPVTPAR